VRGLLANRFVVAALAIIVLGGLYGLAGLGHTVAFAEGARLHPPARAPVSAAISACPSPGSAGVTSGGIAVATAPAAAGAGQAVVSSLVPAGSAAPSAPRGTLTHPGQLDVSAIRPAPAVPKKLQSPAGQTGGSVPATAARGGVAISAAGSMAQGLEVEQTGAGGLVTARCGGPGTDFWFVGPGESSAAGIQLYLMNADSQPASAGVEALTDSGPTLAGADSGITIPPHSMVVQSLVKLLHGSRVVALHVSASSGRLVAAVRETKDPRKPGAWLPVTAAPSRHLVLAGLPGSAGTRELYVAVPGSNNAQVKLTAVTAKGSYPPAGGSGIQLAGGSAATVALPSLGGTPAAIEISASVPVTAAMLVPGGAAGAPGAFAVGSGPVQEQGVVADNPAQGKGSASLVLSAPLGAGSVRIAVAAQKSVLAPQSGKVVQVAAGRTVVVRLQAPRGAAKASAFMVVITPQPGSGPVYAGRVLTVGSALQSILPVLSSPTWIPLPGVSDSLTAVLP
jgi:Family of unknown function (DUF5719)